MSARRLLLAAILTGGIAAPIGTFAEDNMMTQKMPPPGVQLPVEAKLPVFTGATRFLFAGLILLAVLRGTKYTASVVLLPPKKADGSNPAEPSK